MTNNTNIGIKKSRFTQSVTIPNDATLDFVSNGQNFKIKYSDLLAGLGVTGSIIQGGDPLGAPVLDVQGSTNVIRNLSGGFGISASINPQNGIDISTDFSFDQTGAVIVDDPLSPSPKFKSMVGGSGITIDETDDTLTYNFSGAGEASKVLEYSDTSTYEKGNVAKIFGISIICDVDVAIPEPYDPNKWVLFDKTLSNGLVDSVEVTFAPDSTVFDHTDIRAVFTDYTNEDKPRLITVEIPAQTGVVNQFVNTNVETQILVTPAGTLLQKPVEDITDILENADLGVMLNDPRFNDGAGRHNLWIREQDTYYKLEDIWKGFLFVVGGIALEGCVITPNFVESGLRLDRSAGRILRIGRNRHVNKNEPHLTNDPALTPITANPTGGSGLFYDWFDSNIANDNGYDFLRAPVLGNVDPNNYNPPSPVSFNVASITSDGLGTATAVLSTGQANKIGNGIVNTNVQILGADQPEYNVFKTITVIDSDPASFTFTYPISGTPVTPATGTITCEVARAPIPLNGGQVQIQRIVCFGGSVNSFISYGRVLYRTVDEARQKIENDPYFEFELRKPGAFRGYIITTAGMTDWTDNSLYQFLSEPAGITASTFQRGKPTGILTGLTEDQEQSNIANKSTGLISGGLVTSGTNPLLEVTIAAGEHEVVDHSTTPFINTIISWSQETDVDLSVVADLTKATVFILKDVDGNTVYISRDSGGLTSAERRQNTPLAVVRTDGSSQIRSISNLATSIIAPVSQTNDLSLLKRFQTLNGTNIVSELNPATTLESSKASGITYGVGINTENSLSDPNYRDIPAVATIQYRYVDRNGETTGSLVSEPDSGNYDLNGVLTPFAGNNYKMDRLWLDPVNNLYYLQYGTRIYTSAQIDRGEPFREVLVTPTGLNDVAYVISRFLIKAGATTWNGDATQEIFQGDNPS